MTPPVPPRPPGPAPGYPSAHTWHVYARKAGAFRAYAVDVAAEAERLRHADTPGSTQHRLATAEDLEELATVCRAYAARYAAEARRLRYG